LFFAEIVKLSCRSYDFEHRGVRLVSNQFGYLGIPETKFNRAFTVDIPVTVPLSM